MSTWIQRAEAQLETHSAALHVIEGLAHIVKDALVKPGSDAAVVLKIVEGALETLIAGFDGKITKEEIEKLITSMADRRAALNASKDAKLDAKFDDGGQS